MRTCRRWSTPTTSGSPSRTGIKERRIAAKDEYTSDMAARAALKAMEQAKVEAEEIDLILVATATPDMMFPATACFVQTKIGAKNAACLDVSAACAGFLFRGRNRRSNSSLRTPTKPCS